MLLPTRDNYFKVTLNNTEYRFKIYYHIIYYSRALSISYIYYAHGTQVHLYFLFIRKNKNIIDLTMDANMQCTTYVYEYRCKNIAHGIGIFYNSTCFNTQTHGLFQIFFVNLIPYLK